MRLRPYTSLYLSRGCFHNRGVVCGVWRCLWGKLLSIEEETNVHGWDFICKNASLGGQPCHRQRSHVIFQNWNSSECLTPEPAESIYRVLQTPAAMASSRRGWLEMCTEPLYSLSGTLNSPANLLNISPLLLPPTPRFFRAHSSAHSQGFPKVFIERSRIKFHSAVYRCL
jgi:hypothetical protein